MSDRLYIPPVAEIQQGDIYEPMAAVSVRSRPFRAARHWRSDKDGRDLWVVHPEDGQPPAGGFTWEMAQGGEPAFLAHAFIGRAIVLSHDCEIENDQTVRTVAMIRPAGDLTDGQRDRLFSGREEDVNYAAFPLEAQADAPAMERSFVDLRRLTTVRPDVLSQSVRIASLSDELRAALAEHFWLYLFRRMAKGR